MYSAKKQRRILGQILLFAAALAALPALAGAALAQTVHQGQKLGDIKEDTPLFPPKQREFGLPLPKPPAQKAPPPAALSPAAAIGAYPLSEALLSRVEKIHAEILNLPDPEEEDDSDDDIRGGVDILIKAMEKRPDIMSILGRNLIGARDYIIATQALANALAAASGAAEGQVFGESSQISSANLAFGKKYAGRIRKLLEE